MCAVSRRLFSVIRSLNYYTITHQLLTLKTFSAVLTDMNVYAKLG